jgi:hypothetical protein
MVALVTIWCLGCSGYRQLLDGILGMRAGSVWTCASAMNADGITHVDSSMTMNQAKDGRSMVSAPADCPGFDCGCGISCHAPSPPSAAMTASYALPAAVVQPQLPAPASVSRAPLVPPPEFAA